LAHQRHCEYEALFHPLRERPGFSVGGVSNTDAFE
jgi:hypothetical protein